MVFEGSSDRLEYDSVNQPRKSRGWPQRIFIGDEQTRVETTSQGQQVAFVKQDGKRMLEQKVGFMCQRHACLFCRQTDRGVPCTHAHAGQNSRSEADHPFRLSFCLSSFATIAAVRL